MQEDILSRPDRARAPAVGLPQSLGSVDGSHRFEVVVVFTSFEATLSALRRVRTVVTGLSAHVTLLAAQVVPYPLPLEQPPVTFDLVQQRLKQLVNRSRLEMTSFHYLCRDRLTAVDRALKPSSLVVIGASHSWWKSRWARELARKLRRRGHDVIFHEMR